MVAVRDRLDEVGDGTEIVLVTFTDQAHAESYQSSNDVPFPVLIDKDRLAYRAFGLGRGSLWRVWGWRALRSYIEILRVSGLRGLHRPIEDSRQLGGDFIVDADGTLAWTFYGEGPDDRPSVDELVAALRAL